MTITKFFENKNEKQENVVLLMGITLEPLSVITEFMSGGSLLSYLQKNKSSIELETKYKIILGIARGMLHLHLEK